MHENHTARLLVETNNYTATFTIDHPEKRNALTPGILESLSSHLKAFSETDDVRCVIIRGAGDKLFSSGYDIGAIPSGNQAPTSLKTPDVVVETLKTVKGFPYPVIAMINGDAFGAAFNLCACCDIRIAADGVRMGMTAARLGVGYDPEGIRQFIDAFGISRTREIFYTAALFQGRDLVSKGFVDHLVPISELEAFTESYSRRIIQNAPLTLKGVKQVIGMFENRRSLDPADLEKAHQAMLRCFQSDDLIEGRTAFLEKRTPVFKGR